MFTVAWLYCFVPTGREFQNIRHTLFQGKGENTVQNQQEVMGATLSPLAQVLGDSFGLSAAGPWADSPTLVGCEPCSVRGRGRGPCC